MDINKNMLRESAEKLPPITDAMWAEVCDENRKLAEEFLDENKQLSVKTLEQYRSAIKQWFYWVCKHLGNKGFNKITKREFMKFMNYQQERGLSSASINFRKSCISSFNNWIELIVAESDEQYKSFKNFTRGLPSVAKNKVYDKVAISKEEYDIVINYLTEKNNYLGLAWVATAFNVGARRAELIQFKTEILDYPITDGKNYVMSHIVRGKGKSITGKTLQYMINLEALKYMKLYVENRGYESEYIFTTKYGNNVSQISIAWANEFCTRVLSPLLGRRINVHLFKGSCVTNLLEAGVEMKLVSKYVAHHESIETTSNFYDLRDLTAERDNIF